jgi:hypothetical protein
MRIAAASASAVLGLGFGIPCLLGMIHLARTGETWTFLGFLAPGGLGALILIVTGALWAVGPSRHSPAG